MKFLIKMSLITYLKLIVQINKINWDFRKITKTLKVIYTNNLIKMNQNQRNQVIHFQPKKSINQMTTAKVIKGIRKTLENLNYQKKRIESK